MIETFIPQVEKASRRIARDFPPVEAEDIQQEILVALLDSETHLQTVPDSERETYVNSLCDHVGKRYAAQERNRGLVTDDRYYYMPEFVKEILPVFFDRNDWESCPGTEAPDLKHGEPLAVMCDLSKAWDTLSLRPKQVVKAAALMTDWDAVAAATGMTAESARKTYSRALHDLTDRMNGETRKRAANYEGPGSRPIRSNQSSIHLTGKEL